MAIDRETQLLTDATAAGITSPRELANFMAQVTHESNGLNRLEESFRYTRHISQIPAPSAWRDGPEALDAARKQALMGRPEPLAELMHGGRNGNDEPGDGWKYHGRGYIQLIGKENYRAAGAALALDLVRRPELAADPQNASKIAVWYWENRVPENVRDDVRAATKAVNGKYNGLEDREHRFDDWKQRLTPEVMHRLAGGHVGQPQPAHPAHSGRLDSRMHPDHAMYEQTRTVVQGEVASPLKRTAEVDRAKAVRTPIEQSEAEIAKLAPPSPAPAGEGRRQTQEAAPRPRAPDIPSHGR